MSDKLNSNEGAPFGAVVSLSCTSVYAKQNFLSTKPGSPRREERVTSPELLTANPGAYR
jgi:hypothetical protein